MQKLQRKHLVFGLALLALPVCLIVIGCSLFGGDETDRQPPTAVGVETPPPQVMPPATRVEEPRAIPTRPATVSAPAPPDPMQLACEEGMQAWQSGDLLRAREILNRVMHEGCPAEQQTRVRQILSEIAEKTIFSPEILPGDRLVLSYQVVRGDTLAKVARKHKMTEELIRGINQLPAGSKLRPGGQIKVIQGPFSATVTKGSHEMHLYLQDVYVRTCKVALGSDNKTPTGKWVVTNRLRNPAWTDPRTGKRYGSTDPDNPLGGFWVALKGVEGNAVGKNGYGIHGTIDEASIGTDASLGCVRLGKKDVADVYAMLAQGSVVTITE